MLTILSGMLTVLSGILMILILVTIHELGHCLAARSCGVGVKQFSIGFGPGIVIWRTKNFPVYLRFIPLGGFVSLKSEGKTSDQIYAGKCLEEAAWWQRIWIFVAGIVFNLILAVIIRLLMFYFAPSDTQIQILSLTVNFMSAPAWYLAPVYAVKMTFTLFAQFFVGVLLSFWRILLPIAKMAPPANSGIIGTISLGQNINNGVWSYCGLIYFVSCILAALNLLPLMPFDGGHIFLVFLQKIFGQNLVFKIVKTAITYIGLIFLASMLLLALMSDTLDIFNFFKGR